jgi:aminopeptidase N
MTTTDPHSYADDAQPSSQSLDLDLNVDFEARVLTGSAMIVLDRPADGELDLDTRNLAVQSITDGAGASLRFDLAPEDRVMGSRLRVHTHSDRVLIRYQTSPSAQAMQWLHPAQTKGGRHPYVFTQCQAIHARSIVPCQDTPRIRVRYEAKLNIPAPLKAVMAAAHLSREDLDAGRARETFTMPQAIPTYLLAFAVGNIASKDIGPRSRVYAEPETIDAAAWELADVDRMLTTAEKLFGEYVWDRFDVLLMPPSFPYGGMENPRLTFLTPTLLAGDRSLVNVVGHELAHSWTGNLVTNATLNDFWLNEGFTVYAERRILEALEGTESVALQAAIGRKHLETDMARLSKIDPKLTRLKTDLAGLHPDDVYSIVPYEKGYLFLLSIEQTIGRERFDRFLKDYIAQFRFQSITTEDFLAFLRSQLGADAERIDTSPWIAGSGLPSTTPVIRSQKLERIERIAESWRAGERPSPASLSALGPTEWQTLLSSLPRRMSPQDCAFLDGSFHLGEVKNAEIRVAWLAIAAASGYAPAQEAIRGTLRSVGRMKYLRPLYTALVEQGAEGRAFARRVFEEAKAGYHPVARQVIEGVV